MDWNNSKTEYSECERNPRVLHGYLRHGTEEIEDDDGSGGGDDDSSYVGAPAMNTLKKFGSGERERKKKKKNKEAKGKERKCENRKEQDVQ